LLEDGQVAEDLSSYRPVDDDQVNTVRNAEMTETGVRRVISRALTKKQRVLKEADRVIKAAVGEDQAHLAEKIRKRLDNDTNFSSLLQ
jgi:hypothetical protein